VQHQEIGNIAFTPNQVLERWLLIRIQQGLTGHFFLQSSKRHSCGKFVYRIFIKDSEITIELNPYPIFRQYNHGWVSDPEIDQFKIVAFEIRFLDRGLVNEFIDLSRVFHHTKL
jgi:hypothetical protein